MIVGVLMLATLSFVVAEVHKSSENEATSKRLLAQQLSKLTVPAGCTEANRQYQEGDADAVSTWLISYDCQTTGDSAYQAILATLKKQAFTVVTDSTLPVKQTSNEKQQALAYNFTYTNKQFTVDYSFIPTKFYSDSSSLQASPITGIDLSLSRSD